MKRFFSLLVFVFSLVFMLVSCETAVENQDPVPEFLQGTWQSEYQSQLYWHFYTFSPTKVRHYSGYRKDMSQGLTLTRDDNFTIAGVYEIDSNNYRIARNGDDTYMTVVFSPAKDYFIYGSEKFIKNVE
jgi:hypothetical protein